jgi:acyl-CoA synthetase (AMP-forming)/AMP-acid ligase II
VRSAGSRHYWRIVFRPRSFASTRRPAFPFATRTAFAFPAPAARAAIGRIGTVDDGGGRFEGYTDAGETEKKILRDVLAKGDAWFRTGDLMMRLDESGYFHLVDRVGDTFGSKGEIVATSEVNEAVAQCPASSMPRPPECPGADGRAGMAAVVVDNRFDLAEFRTVFRGGCPPMRARSLSAFARHSIPLKPSSKRNISWFARIRSTLRD